MLPSGEEKYFEYSTIKITQKCEVTVVSGRAVQVVAPGSVIILQWFPEKGFMDKKVIAEEGSQVVIMRATVKRSVL